MAARAMPGAGRGGAAPSTAGRSAAPARAPRLEPGLYIVHTQPGLEQIALEEVAARVPGARALGNRMVAGRAGIGIFHAPAPKALAGLRTAEDVFALIGARRELDPGRPALDRIRQAVREMPPLEWALDARVAVSPGSRAGRRLRFRVVARMTGDHDFRRADLKRSVELAMGERSDHTWRIDEDRADIELWTTLLEGELIVALRLSGAEMRHRDYRAVERPASLRPSVAAAMAFLSDPRADDVVLDPFCGTGTLLIERALAGRYRMLIGGDNDSGAIEAARTNIGPRFKPIELHQWDAAAIPLDDHSVATIVANLPWGFRYGSHRENRRLYPRVFAEMRRVLRPGGKMVLLTGETRLMGELRADRTIMPSRIVPVSILGTDAAIYVVGEARKPLAVARAQT